jgi:hypothetical protein
MSDCRSRATGKGRLLTRCCPSCASAVRKFDQAFCLAGDYSTFEDRGGVAQGAQHTREGEQERAVIHGLRCE